MSLKNFLIIISHRKIYKAVSYLIGMQMLNILVVLHTACMADTVYMCRYIVHVGYIS